MVMLSVRVRQIVRVMRQLHQRCLFLKVTSLKATDNAEHPNSSTSDPVKATDTTPPTVPTLDTDLGGKAVLKHLLR